MVRTNGRVRSVNIKVKFELEILQNNTLHLIDRENTFFKKSNTTYSEYIDLNLDVYQKIKDIHFYKIARR